MKNLRFASRPRAKVRRQGPPGSARAQPCNLFWTGPKDIMMMLYWLTLYSGYRFVSSSPSWLYFLVFSKSLDSLFSSHGQLISITLTCLLVLSMTMASILLAFTWVVSANNGTSQKAVACSFSYNGLGVTCENHGYCCCYYCYLLLLLCLNKFIAYAKNIVVWVFY